MYGRLNSCAALGPQNESIDKVSVRDDSYLAGERLYAVLALANIGPDSVPAFTAALTDLDLLGSLGPRKDRPQILTVERQLPRDSKAVAC